MRNSVAEKLFFHGQKNCLKLEIFNGNQFQSDGKLKVVVNFDSRIKNNKKVVSKLIPKSSYRHLSIIFNIPMSNTSDYPIDNFIKIQIYHKGKLVYEYEFSNGYICDRGKFWERTIGFILSKRIKNIDIKYLSGAGNPDFIVKDINIEVTTKTNQLSFSKFSDDYLKYQDRKESFKIEKFILVHDAHSVQPQVINSLRDKNDAWVLDVETFDRNVYKILTNNITNNRMDLCKQRINYSTTPPLKREIRVIKHKIDFLDKGNKIKLKLKQESPEVELLYIRDTRPDDLALIIQIALENKNNYLGRRGFIDILLKKENLDKMFQFHNWKEETKKRAISREFWFRPAIHMGLIDGDYKVTTVGEYFYKLHSEKNKDKFKLFFSYRLLKAPGVEEFLKTVQAIQNEMIENNIFSKVIFKKEMIEYIVDSTSLKREAAERYYQSIMNWLRTLNIYNWINKKGSIINAKLINALNKEFDIL